MEKRRIVLHEAIILTASANLRIPIPVNEKKVEESEKDFRIAESLFESRDAKALVGHQVLEFEALSNDPIIIIIDLSEYRQ